MFEIRMQVLDKLQKQLKDKVLDPITRRLAEIELQQRKARLNRAAEKFKAQYKRVDTLNNRVPVFRFVGHDYGKKYSGADLRAIRAKQTQAALERNGLTKETFNATNAISK